MCTPPPSKSGKGRPCFLLIMATKSDDGKHKDCHGCSGDDWVFITTWSLYSCQGYIKARMKSEKRRTRLHSGHGTIYYVFYARIKHNRLLHTLFKMCFSSWAEWNIPVTQLMELIDGLQFIIIQSVRFSLKPRHVVQLITKEKWKLKNIWLLSVSF